MVKTEIKLRGQDETKAIVKLPGKISPSQTSMRICPGTGPATVSKEEIQMAKKEKCLCKWKEDDMSKKFDKLITIVSEPKFVCKKCGRVADKKKWLHKPVSLK